MERLNGRGLLKMVVACGLVAGAVGLVFAGGKPGGREVVGGGPVVRSGLDGKEVVTPVRSGEGLEAIAWMTVEQAGAKLQKEKRPVIIDLYTSWCGWCKVMDQKTYSNKQVGQYLQEKFYTVKVDAETHADISWAGKTYRFNPQYKSNEFALYLTHGRLEFPTTIIIVPGEAPQAIPGYLQPRELELLVKYFGEGAYRTRGFDDFQKTFKASW